MALKCNKVQDIAFLNLDTVKDEGVISKNEWKSFDRLSPVAHLLDIFSARIGTKSSWDKLVKIVEEAGEQVVQLFISVTIANIVDILRVDRPSAGLTSWRTRRAGSSSAGRCSSPVSGCSPSAPAFCQKHNFPPAFYIKCSRLWISNFNQVHWNDLPLRHHTKTLIASFDVYHKWNENQFITWVPLGVDKLVAPFLFHQCHLNLHQCLLNRQRNPGFQWLV